MTDLPSLALSVRQPWAWAIIFGGKNVENRSQYAITAGKMKPGRIAIHAAKVMTRQEYESAAAFMGRIGVKCPQPDQLLRGGIIGSVEVVEITKSSMSPWYMGGGQKAIVLRDPVPCDFIPTSGQLGYFEWSPNGATPEPPAKWMQPVQPRAQVLVPDDLFYETR